VLENRHLKYVFRAQPSGRQFGLASTGFIAAYAQEKFGKAVKDLRTPLSTKTGRTESTWRMAPETAPSRPASAFVANEGYSACPGGP
jgi:hypothetical protein